MLGLGAKVPDRRLQSAGYHPGAEGGERPAGVHPARHRPGFIRNTYSPRLGHRGGRRLGAVFPHDPEFRGRRVVTFHNQRDFVFMRHHRYVFAEDGRRARLQELGPRFTLRLKWVLAGPFDTRLGDFEWFHRGRQLGTGRKRFHL